MSFNEIAGNVVYVVAFVYEHTKCPGLKWCRARWHGARDHHVHVAKALAYISTLASACLPPNLILSIRFRSKQATRTFL